MATFSFTRPEEGDAVVATDIQTPMTDVQTAVNGFDLEAVKRRSLNHNNVPSLVVGYGQKIGSYVSGGVLTLYPISTTAPNNGAAPPVYQPGTVAGWQRLSWSGAAAVTSLQADALATEVSTYHGIQLSSSVDLSDTTIAGLEVRWHVNVKNIGGTVMAGENLLGGMGIQIQVHTANGWYTQSRWERWCNKNAYSSGASQGAAIDCINEIRGHTLVRLADISGSASKVIDGVRMVAGAWSWQQTPSPGGSLWGGTLAAWAVQSGGP